MTTQTIKETLERISLKLNFTFAVVGPCDAEAYALYRKGHWVFTGSLDEATAFLKGYDYCMSK